MAQDTNNISHIINKSNNNKHVTPKQMLEQVLDEGICDQYDSAILILVDRSEGLEIRRRFSNIDLHEVVAILEMTKSFAIRDMFS